MSAEEYSEEEMDRMEEDMREWIREARPIRVIAGIYLLYYRRRLVYVGQSVNIHARIVGHEARFRFTQVFHIEVQDADNRDLLERVLIERFQPQHNRTFTRRGKRPSKESITWIRRWHDRIYKDAGFNAGGQANPSRQGGRNVRAHIQGPIPKMLSWRRPKERSPDEKGGQALLPFIGHQHADESSP